jgi:hypothetical protein
LLEKQYHCDSCGLFYQTLFIRTKFWDDGIVSDAKREYEAWRDSERAGDTEEQRLERLEREMREIR